jgi:hypothetical protein
VIAIARFWRNLLAMRYSAKQGYDSKQIQNRSIDSLVGTARRYSALTMRFLAARSGRVREQRQERSMTTFMFLSFVLVFLLGSIAGAWLTAITVRSR